MLTAITLTPAALALILEFEVGGGETYYNRYLKRPTVPGEASGVTIGCGYDLGYNTKAQFVAEWHTLLSEAQIDVLSPCLGKTRASAEALVERADVKAITIPWSIALSVFNKSTVPRFWNETRATFPGVEKLPPDAQGALLSLVFNRGGSLDGDRRREMRGIRDAIAAGNIDAVPGLIRSMKRLWVGNGVDGLLRRRDAEAALFASAIKGAAKPVEPVAPAASAHKIAVKGVAFAKFYEEDDTLRVKAREFIIALRGAAYLEEAGHALGFNKATGYLTLGGHDLDGKTGGPEVKGVLKPAGAFCEIRPLAMAFGGKVDVEGKNITVALIGSTGSTG